MFEEKYGVLLREVGLMNRGSEYFSEQIVYRLNIPLYIFSENMPMRNPDACVTSKR